MSWAEQQKKARRFKPAEVTRQVCVDEDVARTYFSAEAALDEARQEAWAKILLGQTEVVDSKDSEEVVASTPAVQDRQAKFDAAKVRYDEESVFFTFRALSGEAKDALLAEHPPREGNSEDETVGYNPETFRPALVAACHVYYETDSKGVRREKPGMTYEDAVDLKKSWSAPDFDALFEAAFALITTSRVTATAVGKG